MSSPLFTSPLLNEAGENDFSFPIEAPYDPNNSPLVDDEGIRQHSFSNTSLPMWDYQELSMFLDHEFPTTQETNNLVALAEQVGVCPVQQAADQSSSDGYHFRHRSMDHASDATGEEPRSSIKKLDQNAKEKMRRMKLNAAYLALCPLLPDTNRAKEKWTAPYILDRALEYIPQVEAEIKKLTLEKSNMLSVIGKTRGVTNYDKEAHNDKQTLTVSINEVKRGDLIIQICQQRDKVDNYFSNLIQMLEGEGMVVVGASSLWACEDRSCFHLHVQMNENTLEANYVADLRKKILFWLSRH